MLTVYMPMNNPPWTQGLDFPSKGRQAPIVHCSRKTPKIIG